MPAQKLSVPKLSDAIAETLERRILEGVLKPGDRLPAERDLAAELGVSRPSLREAIQKLASRGLLRSRQGGGTFVTGQLDAAFSDPWRDMLGAHPDLRGDVAELRRVLAAQAAEWAAERRTPEDMTRLQQKFADLRAALLATRGDIDLLIACDAAFHQAIVEAAHNVLSGHLYAAVLRLLVDDIRLNFSELREVPRAFSLLVSQHTALFEAIRDQRPAAARAAMEAHLDFVAESMAQSLRTAARRETATQRLRDNTDFQGGSVAALASFSSHA
ncbi:MAG: GntR family transcriptional regulator [Zoogloeaceae bacterium]|jgi:GntR family transcriptional repressor for pyruvate dehydrogenase complex|nr:GntR family transcriptional regulator [Zoogloeaceae bacterium]